MRYDLADAKMWNSDFLVQDPLEEVMNPFFDGNDTGNFTGQDLDPLSHVQDEQDDNSMDGACSNLGSCSQANALGKANEGFDECSANSRTQFRSSSLPSISSLPVSAIIGKRKIIEMHHQAKVLAQEDYQGDRAHIEARCVHNSSSSKRRQGKRKSAFISRSSCKIYQKLLEDQVIDNEQGLPKMKSEVENCRHDVNKLKQAISMLEFHLSNPNHIWAEGYNEASSTSGVDPMRSSSSSGLFEN